MPRHCECSFVSCFPTPAFHTAKFFGVFFKCKGGVLFFFFFFYSPSALPSPNTLCIRLSLTLSPYTSWFFHLPQVHGMIPLPQRSFSTLLPIPAHIIFLGCGVGSLALFKKRFFSRQVVAPFLTFIRQYTETVSTLCSCWTRAHTGHLHMCAKTIEKPLSSSVFLAFFLFWCHCF